MRIFSPLYARVMRWVRHPHAPWYLFGLSFAESSFFPIPPDVMLAPMSLAHPPRAWRYAALTTLASVLGGILGYLIGLFAYDLVAPWIEAAGYGEKFRLVQAWFDEWGFWAIFVAGFSPVPYKLFTVGAGVVSMAFIPFIIASAIGRGARFFLVSSLMYWGGERMEQALHEYIDRLGWLTILAALIAYLALNSGG
jgi:membrane protein YqaA with SNARE-associated domain